MDRAALALAHHRFKLEGGHSQSELGFESLDAVADIRREFELEVVRGLAHPAFERLDELAGLVLGGLTWFLLFAVFGIAAVTGAGLESALVDARELEERWVVRGRMDVREGLRYLHDLLEVVGYIQDAGGVSVEEGHDVENYIALVNGAATPGVPGDAVTAGGLEDAASLELLNPTFYWALYAVLGRYLVGGERDAPIPALEIGELRMMPTIHVRLAPFGREYAAGVTAAWKDRVLRAGVRIGDGPWGGFDGLELEGRRLHAGPRLTLGGRVGLWRQFDLPIPSPEATVGGMAVVRATISVRRLPVSPVVELGGKTGGYVPGEDLSGGVIARIGGAFSF